MLQRQKYQSHGRCPRCNKDNEDVLHVLQCNDIGATALWNQEIEDLSKWLSDNGSDPNLCHIICSSLQSWRNGKPLPSIDNPNPLLRDAIYKQDSIGWKSFLDGFIVREWRSLQETHMRTNKDHRSSLLWMSKFQRRIWEIPWKLWNHRNETLHGDGNQIHKQEDRNINFAIIKEWNLGIQDLGPQFLNLFRGRINDRLKDTSEYEKLWLANVWSARDYTNGPQNAHSTDDRESLLFYDKWKAHCVDGDQ